MSISKAILYAKVLSCSGLFFASQQVFAAIGVDMQGYFAQGNAAYARADWISARESYEKALQLGQSSALRYNLGNVCYLQGSYGSAIWNYQCALALDPNDNRTQANLNRALQKLDLNQQDNSITQKITHAMNASAWGWVAALSFWGMVGLLVFPRLYNKNGPLAYCLSAICASLLLIACVALNGYHQSRNIAIILRSDTPIYKAAAPSSGIVGYAREGEAVRLDSNTHQDYIRLTTSNGVAGWVNTTSVGIIWN